MIDTLFQGQLVRLSAEEPETFAKADARWLRNTEYMRLLWTSTPPLWSAKKYQEWFEKALDSEEPEGYLFTIRTLAEDLLIGFCVLWTPDWSHRDTWLTIGIGEPDAWGKGYGSDAVRILLRFGFEELNLERISLGTFSYNKRAIRSYEKVGFTTEGKMRKAMRRDGRWFDMITMGILRTEWLNKVGG